MADDQTSPAPDANTYNAPAPWDPKVPDTLPISQPQQPSIQNIPGLSSEAYQRVVSDTTALEKKKIAQEERDARGLSDAAKKYDAQLKDMFNEEGATAAHMGPWTPELMAPPPTNLWEKFGSPGFVIGMLASSFTGMPMVSALNAGAAAMNAINEGDEANYHRAFDTWKVNTELMQKRFNMEKEAFDQIEHLRKNYIEEWTAKALANAARFSDERMKILLENGMYPDAIKAQDALATSVSNIEKYKKEIEDNNLQRMIVNAQITDENGQLKPEYAKDPSKIAQAKVFATQLMKEPQTVDQMVYYNRLRDPDFQVASSSEQNKMLIQDARDLAMAKSRGNVMQQEIERQWVEHDATHPNEDADTRNNARAKIASDVVTSFKAASPGVEAAATFKDVREQVKKEHPDWDDAHVDLETNKQIASSKNRFGGGPDTIKSIADAIESGDQPPVLTGLYGMSGPVREELQKNNFNLAEAQLEWTRAQRQITALNGAQLTRYVGLARSVNSTIDEVKDLSKQMKQGGVPIINKLELDAYINTEGNSPKGRLATRYRTAVNTLKEEFANLAQGGYAPTEPVWKLANQQINANYGVDQMNDSLAEIKRLIGYRLHAIPGIETVGAGAANRYTGEKGEKLEADKPPVEGAIQYKGAWYTRGPNGEAIPVQQ